MKYVFIYKDGKNVSKAMCSSIAEAENFITSRYSSRAQRNLELNAHMRQRLEALYAESAPTTGLLRNVFPSGRVSVGGIQLRTTYCSTSYFEVHTPKAETLEEHEAIVAAEAAAYDAERTACYEKEKAARLATLNAPARGWYSVQLIINCWHFNARGNDRRKWKTYTCKCLADSALDAYNKCVDDIKGNASIMAPVFPTIYDENDFQFVFLGVLTDENKNHSFVS